MKKSHVLFLLLLVQIIVLFPLHCLSDEFVSSKATYYGSPDYKANPRGQCGYGELGRDMNNGEVSGVSLRLWKNGTSCGACYQVRCKIPTQCSEEGVKVVATDLGEGDGTDFILSPKAYGHMARPGTEKQLYSFGVVDIEYQRIPCEEKSIVYKIHETSHKPRYLAIVPLYVGGINDIIGFAVWQRDRRKWRRMEKVFGTVYGLKNPPRGTLTVRFLVHGRTGIYWIKTSKAIPGNWTAGATYDSNVILT